MHVKICMGSSCYSRGNNQNLALLEKMSSRTTEDVRIELTGQLCMEACKKGPHIEINSTAYTDVSPHDLPTLLAHHQRKE
ncbi:(2Fe-2S) ferredoxin domain-containing protein [Chitinivibrio alkaliphilus]|uniref:Uncharacterized protein n=1 Tax=Chitinivibrio alkaliphilus ACht1 TaxID=1313304 RepID=U7DCB9_9BACT|nr:NAD(P)H-dependent oxidoreductase subunit E [Chitinivibrio alkaliphilus]ERP32070.1 hypothetical protein CALK_1057 [Chitinivibrio alkaliphilus ACht1]